MPSSQWPDARVKVMLRVSVNQKCGRSVLFFPFLVLFLLEY